VQWMEDEIYFLINYIILKMKREFPVFVVIAVLLGVATASEGDKSKVFRSCLKLCTTTGCAQSVENSYKCRHALVCDESTRPYVSLPLQITNWGCTDDCK